MQAKRVMTPRNSGLDRDGHIFIRDQHDVKRWTNNPADRDDARDKKFNINNLRIHYVERLIEHRYQGPVDCDDAHAYISVVFNAIAMQRRLKRWKQSTSPMIAWASSWCPTADKSTIVDFAGRVVKRPRKMTAATAGRLLGLSYVEWKTLGIRTIDPADVSADLVARVKAEMKREHDLSSKKAARRAEGARALDDIKAGSIRAFCKRNCISERTLRLNRQKGPEYLSKYLKRHRITEKLPQDFATLDKVVSTNVANQGGNFSTQAGGGRKASQPASPGLVIDVDSDFLDRELDRAERERRRAAERAAAAFRATIWERMAERLRSARTAA